MNFIIVIPIAYSLVMFSTCLIMSKKEKMSEKVRDKLKIMEENFKDQK